MRGQNIEQAIAEINRQYMRMTTTQICETCQLWHTPRCYERRDYNRDARPQDYCAGWRAKK